MLPFMLPGSPVLMEATVASLREHRVVLWSKHGVMARSDISVTRAADRIEYVETAAMYEYMDVVNDAPVNPGSVPLLDDRAQSGRVHQRHDDPILRRTRTAMGARCP